ncbi:cytochrome P450 monooxygenase-like protein [Pleomassaria siparia CBS 279.74]|uniref:Cytochrome P450 monooxygenase-like protein n=1 Tax=Pleomassaria siparia CBS 279.74 TaxID=1314801 RepID=A0A6G1JU20_9PLEO|nr:cytochrome P450 monooxygenase-like protein [Pleomassaria siparia CBS 279.74]
MLTNMHVYDYTTPTVAFEKLCDSLSVSRTFVSWLSLAVSVTLCYSIYALLSLFRVSGIPRVGKRFEPSAIQGWKFFRNASSVLHDGYSRHPSSAWRFLRADTEMIVLPSKYVNELRSLPHSIASPTLAHAYNLSGSSTNMNIILKSNLHFRALQEKLTPNLNKLTGPMIDELNYAIRMELPECKDQWVAMKPYHSILRLVARVSARIFLGQPLCRNEEWLEISTEFTENTFVTLVVLRLFPRFLHATLSWILPSAWRSTNYIRRAQRLLTPGIKKLQSGIITTPSHGDTGSTLLEWMIEIANDNERNAKDLAHLEVVLSLASIHTSQMNAVHVLYDLAYYSEYFEVLRGEIREVMREDGQWSEWTKNSFYKLKKLDSFMRESQRHNPPTLLSYHRIMQQDFVLQDGTVLPRGSHITMPVNEIQNDSTVTSNPQRFDPLRYYNMRKEPNQGHLHQFATTEESILNFGHGKHACPGRFFAALEIKSILVRLIMDYDWKLPDDQARPKNVMAHEFVFPNPEGILYMRARNET